MVVNVRGIVEAIRVHGSDKANLVSEAQMMYFQVRLVTLAIVVTRMVPMVDNVITTAVVIRANGTAKGRLAATFRLVAIVDSAITKGNTMLLLKSRDIFNLGTSISSSPIKVQRTVIDTASKRLEASVVSDDCLNRSSILVAIPAMTTNATSQSICQSAVRLSELTRDRASLSVDS